MACHCIPKKYVALIICLLLGSFVVAGAASTPVVTNAAAVTTKGAAPTGNGTTVSLAITTTSLQAGTYGVPYSSLVTAIGGTPPYTWLLSGASITHPGLPAGLQLSSSASPSSGVISGTPTVVGTYPVIVMVHDHAGSVASKPFVISLTFSPLTITTGGLPPAVVNVPYSATLAASGGRAPYVWSRVSGSLPVGLTMTATGAISGTPTTLGTSNFVVSVTDSEAPPASTRGSFSIIVSSARDIYGGIATLPSPGGASGFFRLELAVKGNVQREMLVSPLGNYFYMQSVFDAEPGFIESGVLQTRYGGDRNLWATHAHNRMLNWGFNALDIYTAATGLPVGTYGGRTGNAVKLPFVLLFAASPDIYLNPQRVPGQVDPIKNITVGVPYSTYNGWQGRLLDVFSPQWQAAYTFEVGNNNSMITGGFASTPWIVGVTLEDADYFWALKGVGTCPNGATYPHPAYLIATTMFNYTAAQNNLGRAYQDTKLYSKYAWVDYLRNKYGSIAALNSAWHSNYTSFDDNGGYGTGTGVLDEDGRHAWMGRDWNNLTDESAGLQADMNGFLYQYVYQAWSIAAKTVRNDDPNHLLFGPSAIGGIGQCGVRPPVYAGPERCGHTSGGYEL